jgi:hypothetical protein
VTKLEIEALPFDQYQRYRLVSDLVNEVRPKGERLKVLDVGGRTALLRSFLPKDDVTLVDLEASDVAGLVLGDGSRLPFQSGIFDVVASFDTLEHVPPARRAAFVAECARVSKRWILIAGPYQAPAVEEAEKLLQRFLVDKLGVEHRYLEEHRHNGLPSRAETEAGLAKAGAQVASIGHGNLERWLALMSISMYLDYEPHLRPLAARIFRFYNHNLYASDHALPVYRHAVIGALHGAPLPVGKTGLEAPVAPAGVLARFQEVAAEIVAFDRARDDWRVERARLFESVATLETDLAQHKVSLAEARQAQSEQALVLRTLEADLAGHHASLTAALRDLESEREAGARVRGELEAELAAHKRVVSQLEHENEDHRAQATALTNQIEQVLAALAVLEADLDGHRRALTEARGIVDEQRAALAALTTDLEAHRAQAVAQESALADQKLVLAERERDLGELRKTVRTLEVDLAGHKQSLAAARAELESLRRELAEVRRAREEAIAHYEARLAEHAEVERGLAQDLGEHKKVLSDVTRDLEGHRQLAADLRGEVESSLAAQARLVHELTEARQDIDHKRAELERAAEILRQNDALIGVLRQDLKNRWKSVKRAFLPKRPTP